MGSSCCFRQQRLPLLLQLALLAVVKILWLWLLALVLVRPVPSRTQLDNPYPPHTK